MQIITLEQLIEAWRLSRETVQSFYGLIIDACWQNMGIYLDQFVNAIKEHVWGALIVSIIILAGIAMLLYRLIIRNIFRSVMSLLDWG